MPGSVPYVRSTTVLNSKASNSGVCQRIPEDYDLVPALLVVVLEVLADSELVWVHAV